MKETIIKSIPLYDGKIVKLSRNLVELPNETLAFREVVKHKQGVCIIPVLNDEIIFVKQYRSGAEKVLLELPAGIVDENEDAYLDYDEWVYDLFGDADIITFLYDEAIYVDNENVYHFSHWFDKQFYMS